MSIKIGNIRTFVPDGSIAIKVDRYSSPLGNPYYMRDESKRDSVCDDYEEYFNAMMYTDNRFINEVNRICKLAETNDITLLCWCAPKRCHAETIKKYIEQKLEDEK